MLLTGIYVWYIIVLSTYLREEFCEKYYQLHQWVKLLSSLAGNQLSSAAVAAFVVQAYGFV